MNPELVGCLVIAAAIIGAAIARRRPDHKLSRLSKSIRLELKRLDETMTRFFETAVGIRERLEENEKTMEALAEAVKGLTEILDKARQKSS